MGNFAGGIRSCKATFSVVGLVGLVFAGCLPLPAAADWQPSAAKLSTLSTGGLGVPEVGYSASGSAIAVWEGSNGLHIQVYARRWDGSAWVDETLIDADPNHNATKPKIALDAAGKAIAVWQQDDATHARIYANRWTGAAWTGPVLIDTGGAVDGSAPQIAIDVATGHAIAVWGESAAPSRVYANRWDGSAWTGATAIDPGGPNGAANPRIAMDALGHAMVVFDQSDGTNSRIHAVRWNGAAWVDASIIDAATGHAANNAQVAVNASGKAVAVWRQSNGTNYRAYANRWNGSSWIGAELLDLGGGHDANHPQVAIDAAGAVIAVWDQSDGTNTRVYAKHWNGSAWNSVGIIDAGAYPASDPQVAFVSPGKAVAVWVQRVSPWYKTYASYWNGSTWAGATPIDASGTYDSYYPQVAADGLGNAIAVWGQGQAAIYGNRWTAAATYSVTYNGNGNTGGAVPVDSNAYSIGQTVTVLGNTGNLVRTGYTFAGWNTTANGSGTSYAAGATFAIAANTTLYAQWTVPVPVVAVNVPTLSTPLLAVLSLLIGLGFALQRCGRPRVGRQQ